MESSPHGITRGQIPRLTAAGLEVASVGPGRLLAAGGTRILVARADSRHPSYREGME